MSRHLENILLAVDRGYYFDFDTFELVTPTGKRVKPKLYGKQRYPYYTFNSLRGNKQNISFSLHKFVAYILYGEDAFGEGLHVRHLDGDVLNLSKENIKIGTSSDNQMDKPSHLRVSAAKIARMSQGKRPLNTKISEEVAYDILKEYLKRKGNMERAPRGSVKEIAEKHGLNRASVQSVCSGVNFKDIHNAVLKEIEQNV